MTYQACIELKDGNAFLTEKFDSLDLMWDEMAATRKRLSGKVGAITSCLDGERPYILFKSVNYRMSSLEVYFNSKCSRHESGCALFPEHCIGDVENSKYFTHDSDVGKWIFHDVPARHLSYGGIAR